MKNLVREKPSRNLHGRLAYSRSFVAVADCAGRDLLDIGCGFGWFELVALDRDARSITGIEPTDADLATVRAHLHDDRVSFRVASALKLPLAASSFDTAVCWEVLEHLPKGGEERAFGEMFRVLRPGGVLYLSTPHAAPIPTLTDPAWWLVGHRHYSTRRVESLAVNAGFIVERLEVKGRAWEVLQTLDLYVAKWIFRRRPFFERTVRERVEREWLRPGFTNVFLRCRKRSGPESAAPAELEETATL